MAGADYYGCDACGRKTFYDAEVNYESGNRVGDMKVICPACADKYAVAVVPRVPSNELFALHRDGELMRTLRSPDYRPRKRSWVFVTEAAAKAQAKDRDVEVVRYVPAVDRGLEPDPETLIDIGQKVRTRGSRLYGEIQSITDGVTGGPRGGRRIRTFGVRFIGGTFGELVAGQFDLVDDDAYEAEVDRLATVGGRPPSGRHG